MKRLHTLGLVMAGLAFLAACDQGGAPSSAPESPKTDLGFTKPGPETPGQAGLSGTVGDIQKPGAPDVNINPNVEDCSQKLNSGEKFESLSPECQKALGTAISGAGAAFSAMSATISSTASSVSSALGSFKPSSFSFSGSGAQGSSVTLPDGCHQDGDVGLSLTDPNLRAAVSKVINKGNANGQITVYDAIKLTWLEIPTSKGFATFSSLEGLKCFINLGLLDVSGHPITSLAPLTSLSKLSVLRVNSTKISDLSPISKLPIAYLHIDSDPTITDLTPLLTMESIKGGMISALNDPQLKKCQLDQLSKLYKVETYDVYCPNADPNASGCGPCGDNGYDCNTKMENKNYTAVVFNQSTSCEPVALNPSEFNITTGCLFDKITLSVNVVDAGEGSTVRLEFQDKSGKTLAKSTTYSLNGKSGNRTFDLAMPNSVSCNELNQNISKVVFYFTDSGFLDMDYSVQYLYLYSGTITQAYLSNGFKGYVDGTTSSASKAYPAEFSGPATQIIPVNVGK